MKNYELKALVNALPSDLKDAFDQSGLIVEHGDLCARGLYLLIQANALGEKSKKRFIDAIKEQGVGLHEDAAFEAFAEIAGAPVDKVGEYYIGIWRSTGWKDDLKAMGGELPSEILAKEILAKGESALQHGAVLAKKAGDGLVTAAAVASVLSKKAIGEAPGLSKKASAWFTNLSKKVWARLAVLFKNTKVRMGAFGTAGVSVLAIAGIIVWPMISDMLDDTTMSAEDGNKPLTQVQLWNALGSVMLSTYITSAKDITVLYLSWEGVQNKHVDAMAQAMACGGELDTVKARSTLEALVKSRGYKKPRDILVKLPIRAHIRYDGKWTMEPIDIDSVLKDGIFNSNFKCAPEHGTTAIAESYELRFADDISKDWLSGDPVVIGQFKNESNNNNFDEISEAYLMARIKSNTAIDAKGIYRTITLIPVVLVTEPIFMTKFTPSIWNQTFRISKGLVERSQTVLTEAPVKAATNASQPNVAPEIPVAPNEPNDTATPAPLQNTEQNFSVSTMSARTMFLSKNGSLRTGPGVNWDIVTVLNKGVSVSVTGVSDTLYNGAPWFRIKGSFGEGYIWSEILSAEPPAAPAPTVQSAPATPQPQGTKENNLSDQFKKDLGTVGSALKNIFGN